MDYHIAKVSADLEADTIEQMHRVCFPDADLYPVRPWAHWWLARDQKGAPAAFAGMKASTLEGVGYLCRAGVLPAHRGQGLQKRLIKAREALARRMDLHTLVTDTIDNPVSSNHLIACGFRLYDPVTPWGHEGALYWRKELL